MSGQRQRDLFEPSFEELLEDCVDALGGWEAAAAVMWPTKDPFDQARMLRAGLRPDRREKLSAREIELLMVEGARAGCLTPLARIARKAGLRPPEPVPPEDVDAALVRAVEAATRAQQDSAAVLTDALAALERRQSMGPNVRGIRGA